MKRFITAVSAGFALAVMALAVPAAATEEAPLTATHTVVCREKGGIVVTITFTNSTGHTYSGDIQRDNVAGTPDEMTGETIATGPHAGKPFGKRHNPTSIPAGGSATFTVEFDEDSGQDHRVRYRIWRGPENDLHVDWKGTGNLDTDCLPEPQPTEPTGSPTGEPTSDPTDEPSESPSGEPSASPSDPATTAPVVDDPDQGAGGLPVTGTSLPLIAGLGAALIAGGAIVLWVIRRRWAAEQ